MERSYAQLAKEGNIKPSSQRVLHGMLVTGQDRFLQNYSSSWVCPCSWVVKEVSLRGRNRAVHVMSHFYWKELWPEVQTLTDPWEVDGVWLLRDLEGIRLEGWWQGVWSRGTDTEYKGIYFLQVLSKGHQPQRHLQQPGGPDGLPVTVSQPFPTTPWFSTSKMAMVKMKVGQQHCFLSHSWSVSLPWAQPAKS